jgi:hypothetical protein
VRSVDHQLRRHERAPIPSPEPDPGIRIHANEYTPNEIMKNGEERDKTAPLTSPSSRLTSSSSA